MAYKKQVDSLELTPQKFSSLSEIEEKNVHEKNVNKYYITQKLRKGAKFFHKYSLDKLKPQLGRLFYVGVVVLLLTFVILVTILLTSRHSRGAASDNVSEADPLVDEEKTLVDGGWGDWSTYSDCSQSCGGGTQHRRRRCDSPRPANEGKLCVGENTEKRPCNTEACSADGRLTAWTQWTTCSVSCGNGTRSRFKTCSFLPDGSRGRSCTGRVADSEVCNTNQCLEGDVWSSWSSWGSCTTTCNNGTQSRERKCIWPSSVHGKNCIGAKTEIRTCSADPCPADGEWGHWKAWGECSASCDTGTAMRHRECLYNGTGPKGKECKGSDQETQVCRTNHCPVDGVWTQWTNWSSCSATCATGVQERVRSCSYSNPLASHGKTCTGESLESKPCSARDCSADGIWTQWTNWYACSASCGEGLQMRMRVCAYPYPLGPYGNPCTGTKFMTRACKERPCLVDGEWGQWKAWGACSASCDAGTMTRHRECLYNGTGPKGKDCQGSNRETQFCHKSHCPVDGVWTQWTNWSSCSANCATGVQERVRSCSYSNPLAPRGKNCTGESLESKPCSARDCSADGVWTQWTNWYACSASCGEGLQMRMRLCAYPHPLGSYGKPCTGPKFMTRPCKERPCLAAGNWGPWKSWSSCSSSCGTGTKIRYRECFLDGKVPAGENCLGLSHETQSCNTNYCPADGEWGQWKSWEACSASCDTGTMMRHRECLYNGKGPKGQDCPGSDQETEFCSTIPCPVDETWIWEYDPETKAESSMWKTPSSPVPKQARVSKSGGTHMFVFFNNRKGMLLVVNSTYYSKWMAYGRCGQIGLEIVKPEPSKIWPFDQLLASMDGVWTQWTNWGSCSVTCATGFQERLRTCSYTNPVAPAGKNCTGVSSETQPCTAAQNCPVDGVWASWGTWSACSASCGGGIQVRRRKCEFPLHALQGDYCPGRGTATQSCNPDPCPTTSP